MTRVANNFEGGSDGVPLTAGVGGNTNTPGNDYFDNIDRAAGGALEYGSNGAYDGSMGIRVATRAVGSVTVASWQTQLGSLTTDHFQRFFFKAGAIPILNTPISIILNAALSIEVAQIRIDGTGSATPGAIDVTDSAGAAVATSSTILVPGNWYRIEYKIHPSATVSYATVRIYANPLAAVPAFTEELNGGSPTTWAGAADSGYIAFGIYANDVNSPSATDFLFFDDPVAGATDWVGPTTPPAPQVMVPLSVSPSLR